MYTLLLVVLATQRHFLGKGKEKSIKPKTTYIFRIVRTGTQYMLNNRITVEEPTTIFSPALHRELNTQ